MSAKATFWAWEQQLKSAEKLVLLSLADCHNADTNRCDPSVKYLSVKTGLNRKTIINSLANLERDGLVFIQKLNGKQNKYSFNFEQKSLGKPVPKTVPVPKTAPVPNLPQTSTKNGTTPVPNLGHEPITNLKDNLKDKAYAFFGDRIRLTQADYDKAKKRYLNINLDDELEQLDLELKNETDKSWFMTMHAKLNFRNKRGERNAKYSNFDRSDRKQTPAERAIEQGRIAIARAEAAEREANQAGNSFVGKDESALSTQMGVWRGSDT